jgi:alcohol dehydrogenase (cytochrome c)
MNRKLKYIALLVSALAILVAGISYYSVPSLKWRFDVVALKLGGQIDGVEMGELLMMIRPGTGFWLQPLAESRNPYSSIFNPFQSDADLAAGESLFQSKCVTCHGPEGVGDSAPSLTRVAFTHGDSDWSLYKNLRDGIEDSAMPASVLENREIWTLVSYVRSLKQPAASNGDTKILDVPSVSSSMLNNSDESPENWLTYSGSFSGQRFSRLTQINQQNATQAEIKWIYQFGGTHNTQEASPIVVAGVMYLTEAPNTVHALDAATGENLWTYVHQNPANLKLCCGSVNRGVAIIDDTVFMGTLDAQLIALNAKTGALRWKTTLTDYERGFSVTAAPLAVEDRVVIGYGGGDLGIRGFVDAVDSSSGSEEWRFYTIPAEGEPGNDTWSGDSWKTGGAATWLTGSYDSKTQLLYWTTGNPAPDYQGDLRLGDNLYANSVVALNIESGELAWHFQFTPHDEHDWDANQIPVLVDREWRGEQRRLLLLANRNAFFYVLDRDTGEFLLAEPFAKQNWATEIDSTGRPILNQETVPTAQGNITWPSPYGATNWQSPTYSPITGLMYVPTLEYGHIVFKDADPPEYDIGELYTGGRHIPIPGDSDFFFAVRAIDPETGKVVWEAKHPNRQTWWKTGGLVSTAGNIIFGGDNTRVFILDAQSGAELWTKNVGGRINAAPVTYEVNGTQYFAIAAGRSIVTVALGQDKTLDSTN